MSHPEVGAAYALGAGEGEAIWFLGTLMTVKATAEQTGGAFGVIEQELPPGFFTPPHVHHAEDEAFYLLEGTATFTCGEQTFSAAAGSFIFFPRGISHSFRIGEEGSARLLQFTAPPGVERFFVEAGESAAKRELPPPGPPDVARMLALAPRFQIELGENAPSR